MIHEALHLSTLSSSKAFGGLHSVPRLWERIPVKPGEEAGTGSQGERDGSGSVGLAAEETASERASNPKGDGRPGGEMNMAEPGDWDMAGSGDWS